MKRGPHCFRSRWVLVLMALAIALPPLLAPGLSGQALAQSGDDIQFNATLQTGPIFPLGRLLPFQVRINNRSAKDIDGSLQVDQLETPAGAIRVSRPAHIPAHSRTTLDLLLQLPPPPPRDKKGLLTPTTEIVLWNAAHTRQGSPEKVMAFPDSSEAFQGREPTETPGVILLHSVTRAESGALSQPDDADPTDAGDVAAALSGTLPYAVTPQSMEPDELFRRVEAYDACRLIALDAAALERLDAAQRGALLRHIRGGATLIIVEPTQALQSSWIAGFLPMDSLNARLSSSIDTREFGRLAMSRPLTEYECEPRSDGAQASGPVIVVASNDRGAVAAYREVGFGRIAMTGFALNSLDLKQPASLQLWMALLKPQRPAFHDPSSLSETPALREQLPSMIGATAPPWRTAALIVIAYVATVAVLLTFSGARRRPMAFAGSALIAVLAAGFVVGLSRHKTSAAPLMAASINVVDLSGDVAKSDSLVTYFGDRESDLSVTAELGTVITPVVLSGNPVATMFPLKFDHLSASLGKLNTVIRAQSTTATPATNVSATLTFDAQGAAVKVNGLDKPLEGARLVTGGGLVFPLEQAAAAQSARRVGAHNPFGIWSDAGGMIASEQSKLRDDLVRSAERRDPSLSASIRTVAGRSSVLRLVGFADAPKGATGVTLSGVDIEKNATIIRIPLDIAQAPAGTAVRIDPGFVQTRRDAPATNAPFAPDTGEWNESSQTGTWLIALAGPEMLGKLAPETLALDVDLRGAGFDIAFRRGQIAGDGKLRQNETGEPVVEWSNASGPRHAVIELSSQDVDANGWVWLLLTVNNSQRASPGLDAPSPWQISRFDPTISGTVISRPEAPRVTWETEPPAAPKKPDDKKPDIKKPDIKKPPAPKPAAANKDDKQK